ncbi:hypothetical protein ATANTOWER_018449 [Ataeniobius toweri]|uniref:Uncharacterized protein n=1 Tax=Ataeniobius toweri TaxID=208326 RepID=A0ABU7BM08_9TELE|nr:hypothetical protein [Ataeniobius toweri]
MVEFQEGDSSGEEHKNPTLPTLQCLNVNLQWLPPVLSFCIQSAYAENPDSPPGATSISRARKAGLPGPLTYWTHSWSFHPSFSPWLIFKSPPERVPCFPAFKYFIINLLKLSCFLSVFLHYSALDFLMLFPELSWLSNTILTTFASGLTDIHPKVRYSPF